MITGFNASSIDPEIQLNAFAIAAHGNRSDAIQSAAARFIRGEVDSHKKKDRCPTVAEFAQECRSEHSRLQAKEWADRRKALPAPEPEPERTPEEQAKWRFWFATLSASMRGDPEAKRLIEGKGWRS